MRTKTKIIIIILINIIFSQKLIIPMDLTQTNHLKAYGLAFTILEKNTNIDCILNYRGGTFMFESNNSIIQECILRGISYELINADELINIYSTIEENFITPNLSGKSLKEALEIANSRGLKLQPYGISGRVVWQSIKAGTYFEKDDICKIKVSI